MRKTRMTSEFQTTSDDLLDQAKAGSGESLGRLLQLYANYLKLVVLGQLEHNLRVRVSPSDVVQETFFEAHRDFPQFRGATHAGVPRVAAADSGEQPVPRRRAASAGREARRARAKCRWSGWRRRWNNRRRGSRRCCPTPARRPARACSAARREVALADQLAELPADYRDVIVLRHIEALPFEEIGQRMGRTSGAVRMLWLRAVKALRERLDAARHRHRNDRSTVFRQDDRRRPRRRATAPSGWPRVLDRYMRELEAAAFRPMSRRSGRRASRSGR